MMWVLKLETGTNLFYLLPGKQYTVGRKNADLALSSDLSVSRQHAAFTVSINSVQSLPGCDMVNSSSVVKLVDNGSKYGTFVKNMDDWRKLNSGDEYEIVDKDIIRFGTLNNSWRVIHVPLICTLSNLKNEEKQHMKNILSKLGGTVSKSWSNYSTHLTMKNVTLTVKAVCALACAKPIVSPEFWNRYWELVSKNMEPPDCNDFIPPNGAGVINVLPESFAVNVKRCTVLRGKHVVFASQMDFITLGCMVLAAGGTVAAFEEYIDAFNGLCEAHVVVIGHSSVTSRTQGVHLIEQFENAKRYLKSKGRRIIDASEIGNAVLHCSTEKYCNSEDAFDTLSSSLNNTQNQDSCFPLVLSSSTKDSQTQEQDSQQSSSAQTMNKHRLPGADTSFAAGGSSFTSTKDIFSSPIKMRPFNELCDVINKRGRAPVQSELPEPKRPARSKNVVTENVSVKLESDEEDLFEYPKNTCQVSRKERIEKDDFSFVNVSKTEKFSEDSFKTVPGDVKSRGRRIAVANGIGNSKAHSSAEKHYDSEDVFDISSDSPNNSQNQNSCFSLDLSSPTREQDSKRSSSAQTMNKHQLPGADTSFAAGGSSFTSTKDIFASPIKMRPFNELCDVIKKRGRAPVQSELPEPKRPARSKNVVTENVSVKLESDEEDPFEYPANTCQVSRRGRIEEDDFSFVNVSKTEKFSENTSSRQSDEMCKGKASTTEQSKRLPKRKMTVQSELPSRKKKAISTSNSLHTSVSSSRTGWTLDGFYNASLLKSEVTDCVDNLSDCINDIFLVEENLLVIRDQAKQARRTNGDSKSECSSSDIKNFKKFHKVMPLRRQILPCVISGDILDVSEA